MKLKLKHLEIHTNLHALYLWDARCKNPRLLKGGVGRGTCAEKVEVVGIESRMRHYPVLIKLSPCICQIQGVYWSIKIHLHMCRYYRNNSIVKKIDQQSETYEVCFVIRRVLYFISLPFVYYNSKWERHKHRIVTISLTV